jgi:hypothetical protein
MADNGAPTGDGGNPNGDGGTTAQQPPGTQGGEPTQQPDTGKTFTQSEMERVIAERLERERRKYAGHDDLKRKAAKLDEFEAAKKSETERLNDQLSEAQTELAAFRVDQVRRDAAQKAGLAPDLWEFVTEADPDAALAQAKRVKDKFTVPEPGRADLRQGSRPPAKSSASPNDALRAMLGHQ